MTLHDRLDTERVQQLKNESQQHFQNAEKVSGHFWKEFAESYEGHRKADEAASLQASLEVRKRMGLL